MRYATLILILLAGGISAEDSAKGKSYLCIADKSVGFIFDTSSKSWDATTFKAGDSKYLVRPMTADDPIWYGMEDEDKGAYGVWQIGEDIPLVRCEEGISEHGWLSCGGEFNTQFKLNSRTNRFLHTFHGSYTVSTLELVEDKDGNLAKDESGEYIYKIVEDTGGDTPFMEIGKCSVL